MRKGIGLKWPRRVVPGPLPISEAVHHHTPNANATTWEYPVPSTFEILPVTMLFITKMKGKTP